MTFWTILVLFCLVAIVFAAWPLYRKSYRLTPMVASVIVFVAALSAIMYDQIGSPGAPSGRSGAAADASGELPDMDAAVTSLRKRLEANPDDVEGWKMLGRTQMAMQDFAGGVDTYEHVMAMEEGKDAQTLVDLAVALLNRDGTQIEGRAEGLLDSALVLDPNNPAARFYVGLAASNRGDTDKAAEHWEILLGLNPPENIRGILEQRLAEWRGEAMPAQPTMSQPAAGEESVPSDAVVSARVSLSAEAMAAITSDATVFVIARDPSAPVPPIAVSRHRVSELPAVISLADTQSMVEGRNLSGFAEIELLARVSLSGGPAATSGDWFGSKIIRPADGDTVVLTIDQQVP